MVGHEGLTFRDPNVAQVSNSLARLLKACGSFFMRQSDATQNLPDSAAMNVDIVGLGQFGNQLIGRDLTFGGDTHFYPTGHPGQLFISAVSTAQILLCGPAGDIALQDAPETTTAGQPPRDASPRGLMRMLMAEHDVTAEVCAISLPAKGAEASVLLEGVIPAAPAAAARAIFADNSVVMSF